MKLRAYAFAVLITLFSFAAQAQSQAGPKQVLQQGMGKLAAYLKTADPSNTRQMEAFLESEIAPYFDFHYMAKWSAGSLARHMNAGQHAQFEKGLRRMFLKTMTEKLISTSYGNPQMTYTRTRRGSSRNEVIVSVRIVQGKRPPLRLDFRFYYGRQGWKVFDVMANGSSAVMHYRQHFSRMVRRYGAQGVLSRM